MMHSLPMSCMSCRGSYVMYEIMYKNYIGIIIGFNMLRKMEVFLTSFIMI